MRDVFLMVMGAVFTLVAASNAVQEIQLRQLSFESARWTEVAGTILRSNVEVHHGKSTTYRPAITYRYQVDGRSFTGGRVLFAPETSEATARDLVDRYPPGNTAIVWIRPADPSTSVLVRQSWDGWSALAAWLFMAAAFATMTVVSGVASAFAVRAALRSDSAPPEPPLEDVEAADGPAPPLALGTLTEATDTSLVFLRKRGGPGWRVGVAVAGAIAGPAMAPLAPMAWWVAGLAIVIPAASLALLYAALPDLALGLSSLAPMRVGLHVRRADVDPYRGEPVYSGSLDGQPLGPDAHRALLDVRVGRLVARVLVVGAKASIVAYAHGRRAAASALQPFGGRAGSRHREASMADLTAALATVLHVSTTKARPSARLARLRWWPLASWLAARAGVYLALAAVTPLDPATGLFFAVGCGVALAAVETTAVLAVLKLRFVPPLEALGREVRALAQV